MLPNHKLPKTTSYAKLDVDDMIGIATLLQDILLQENEVLAKMRLKELAPMQEEKLKLTRQLESFQKLLATDTSVVAAATETSRHALADLTRQLLGTAAENMRRTTIAQTVNKRVMQSIVSTLSDQRRLNVYGAHGQANAASSATLSINHNERA